MAGRDKGAGGWSTGLGGSGDCGERVGEVGFGRGAGAGLGWGRVWHGRMEERKAAVEGCWGCGFGWG